MVMHAESKIIVSRIEAGTITPQLHDIERQAILCRPLQAWRDARIENHPRREMMLAAREAERVETENYVASLEEAAIEAPSLEQIEAFEQMHC